MASIIRGTTPTIEITFSTVQIADLSDAVLTIEVGGTTIISRDLNTATLTTESLVWTLTQAETLSLPTGKTAAITCVWKTTANVRGQSRTVSSTIYDTPIDEVM